MHLMIDLETLSLQPNAVVTQIGWCQFDPNSNTPSVYNGFQNRGCVFAHGCFDLNPAEQIQRHRNVSWSTIQWWLTQDEAARAKMQKVSSEPVAKTLADFVEGFTWSEIEGVWGNGSMFDLIIMEDLFYDYTIKTPWHYRSPRDFKTLRALRPNISGPKPEIAHSAEHDAIAQAFQVQAIMHSLLNETGA